MSRPESQQPADRRGDRSARSSPRAKTAGSTAGKTPRAKAADGDGPRTRGGWTPAGTAAERRAVHSERGTARGERTRRQIIDAARQVFERDGYLDVGVADIVREAGVAHGSYYTYFPSKLEVFRVVCDEVSQTVDRAVAERQEGDRALDPVDALHQSNLRYVDAYSQNAKMYALLEQLGRIDEDLHQAALLRRARHINRIRDRIRSWQERALADPAIDPEPTAMALVSMISNVCNWLFAQEVDDGFTAERAAEAVNAIWVRAVGLRRRPNPEWLEPSVQAGLAEPAC
jgi:AcrR family transcriptional regulator